MLLPYSARARNCKCVELGKKYDIVMANVADMGSLIEQLEASFSDVVPVSLIPKNLTEDVLIPEGYPFTVNLSAKSTMIRKKIEKAMESKEKGAKEKDPKKRFSRR